MTDVEMIEVRRQAILIVLTNPNRFSGTLANPKTIEEQADRVVQYLLGAPPAPDTKTAA